MIIEIKNLRPDQEKVIEGFLRHLEVMGRIGHSAWIAIYADGDGSFRPIVEVNEEDAEPFAEENWKEGGEIKVEYGINCGALYGDFYTIEASGHPRRYDVYDENNKRIKKEV